MGSILKKLRIGRPSDRVWDFSYHDLLETYKTLGPRLDMSFVRPYVLRHAGPSWDRLQGFRSVAEVQKRGQWKTTTSLQRYERHAKVQVDELSFSVSMRRHFRDCELRVEDVLRGNAPPPPPPQPHAGSSSSSFSRVRGK
jgi:hypothetical protein